MSSVKIQWVVGFKQYQWVSEEGFENIIHIQIYIWTMYALCESTLSGGLQAKAMPFRRSFSETIYTFKHTIAQSMRSLEVHWVVCFKQKQWLSEEVFQNIKHNKPYNWTNMRSVKVQCVLGFKHKQWLSEEVFQNIIHIQT